MAVLAVIFASTAYGTYAAGGSVLHSERVGPVAIIVSPALGLLVKGNMGKARSEVVPGEIIATGVYFVVNTTNSAQTFSITLEHPGGFAMIVAQGATIAAEMPAPLPIPPEPWPTQVGPMVVPAKSELYVVVQLMAARNAAAQPPTMLTLSFVESSLPQIPSPRG